MERTLAQVVEEFAGDAVALVTAEDASKCIQYGELRSLCLQFGNHLLNKCDLDIGDVAAIVLPRRTSLAQIVGTLGCMSVGLCAAPLNPTYKIDELEFFVSDAQAKLVVVEAANNSGKSAWVAATRLGLPTCGMTLDWFSTEGSAIQKPCLTMSFFSSSSYGETKPSKEKSGLSKRKVQPDDLALVLHTSGTTSRPKLVPLTHANMVASVNAVVRHYNITDADNTLIVQPLFHIGGLVTPLLSTLSVGGTVAIAQMFDDAKHWQFVDEHKSTWFTAVPTIHKVLLANAERDFTHARFRHGQPRLRFIRSGSAALPPEFLARIEEAFKAPLIESYGMTEAAQLICANPLPQDGNRYAGSVGICAGPRGKVFDPVTFEPAEIDESGMTTGEMCISGPSVMSGYARNPEANAGSFIHLNEDKWFRTGDLVTRTAQGYYSIVGRIKEIINRAGEKIAPAKLDKLLAYEKRKDSVVSFGIPDADFGQAVAAAIVFDPDNYSDDVGFSSHEARRRAELLLKTAMAKLAPHELPTTLYYMHKEDVPKTATGKTKRLKTGELCFESYTPLLSNGVWAETDLASAETTNDDSVPKKDETSQEAKPASTTDISDAKARARAAIAEALVTVGVPLAVADDAPLMQSGLTSMMVFGFIRNVASSLGLDNQLPHMLVFDAPTPEALSADLAARLVQGSESVPPILTTNTKSQMKAVRLSGASWRLPGSSMISEMESDPDGVRYLLDSLGSARERIPLSRWSPESLDGALTGTASTAIEGIKERCTYGGFVRGLGALDYGYFGLSKNEAQLCDPQQRMLLEHVTAALAVSSDTNPREKVKAPEDGGVFIGISFNDWANLTMWNAATPQMRKSVFASSGSFTSYASGRLSFALGMRGPCVSINTACSSGLVALHGARNAVAAGETSTSVAACTNSILEPTISINFAVKGITSPRGRCHTFDSSADGYMRSEACVVLALTGVDNDDGAIKVEDVVVRHDGKSASLTAPNGTAQMGMLAASSSWRDAYEAHGTATPLGDPIEVGALARYVARYASASRDLDDSCLALSGAKCAYGHGEAVAGAIGLLVSLLGLRRGDAAPNGALRTINPAVAADRGQVLALPPTDTLPIESSSASRAIGISSLGASGTIAHAVVTGARPSSYDQDVLCKPWPYFPHRVALPWTPWTPPEMHLVQKETGSTSAEIGNNLDDILQAVRAVVTPLIDEGTSLDESEALLDQGVDSLVALELVAELQAKFPDANLPQTLLVDCPSVKEIAQTVLTCSKNSSRALPTSSSLDSWQNTEGEDGPTVVVKKVLSSTEKPLEAGEQIFFIHGVDGDPLAMLFQQIAAELRFPSSTVRCIEKPKSECFCVEELAAYYLARIKERQPSGKYRLFGHSFGALLAHQMAVQLERNGDEVAALVLGDFEVTYPPSRSGKDKDKVGRFGLEEWEGGEIESIKLACRRFGSMASAGEAFDPDAFRAKVLTNAHSKTERRMRAMFHYMPGYMQRREWDRLLDLWERNMEFLYTVTIPKFGPKRRDFWQPDAVVKGPTLHLRAAGSNEFAAAEEINAKFCSNFSIKSLDGLHYTFLQKPHATAVAQAIDDFISSNLTVSPPAVTPVAVPSEVKATITDKSSSQEDTELSLAGLVARRAEELADTSFVLSWERKQGVVESVSYAEFAARCSATANRLAAKVKSQAAAVLSHATLPAHIAIVALSALGKAAVMLNPRLRAEVLGSLLTKLDELCGCLVTGLSLRGLAARIAPAVASLENVKTGVLLGMNDNVDGLDLDAAHEWPLTTGATVKVPSKNWWQQTTDTKNQGTVIMFTSGTTATPKPIVITSQQLLKSAQRMRRYESERGLTGDNGTLSFLPLFHMMGLAHNFCLNLLASGKLLVHAAAATMPLTLGLLLEAAPVLNPSQLESVAVTAEQLSEMLSVGGELARDIRSRLSSIKCIKVGGSKLPRRVVDTLASASLPVLEHYGSTELCGYVLAAVTSEGSNRNIVGNGMEPVNMEAIDPALNVSLRTGDQTEELGGELVITPSPGHQHATGDIFVETATNKFTFRSRVDGMLVLGSGEMVEPTVVEATVLLELARSVKRCCLCGNGLRRPALLLELRSPPDDTNTLAAITATVDGLNEHYLEDATKLLHTHVLLIEDIQLPTTLKGAVDRSAVQDTFQIDLDAAEAGCLVHHSLQAYNLGYGPKE